MIHEHAFAKANLVLHVGRPCPDGLHPICSVFASLDLADEVEVAVADGRDAVVCPEVPGENLASRAISALRARLGDALPPLEARIDKRIPVAAGLGGGSADAAAVLRAGNQLAGAPLDANELRGLALGLGADVPSQLTPGHALVGGIGEETEPLALPAFPLVLIPQDEGLSTAEVYAELDRLGGGRARLEPELLRSLGGAGVDAIAAAVENDLQPAALSLRPELAGALRTLKEAGAMAAAITGSGPTAFGVFAERADAERAAEAIPRSLVTGVRSG